MIIHGAKPSSDLDVIATRLGELALAFSALDEVLHKFDGTHAEDSSATRRCGRRTSIWKPPICGRRTRWRAIDGPCFP